MTKRLFVIFTALTLSSICNQVLSQNLLGERIRKVAGKKRNIYFKNGIFHTKALATSSSIKAIRHGHKSQQGYERLVFDFGSAQPPRIYGHLSQKEKKIYIDLFSTNLKGQVGSFGSSKFVKKIDFYPVGDEMLSSEVALKGEYSIDVFYLENPGRLVIDIKK